MYVYYNLQNNNNEFSSKYPAAMFTAAQQHGGCTAIDLSIKDLHKRKPKDFYEVRLVNQFGCIIERLLSLLTRNEKLKGM